MGNLLSCTRLERPAADEIEMPARPVAAGAPRASEEHAPSPEAGTFDRELEQNAASGPGTNAEPTLDNLTRPQLSPLDMSKIDNNPRLCSQGFDVPSPGTPSPRTMKQYTHPDNLPGPDGETTHDGHDWVNYGKTEVLKSGQSDHEALRRHMAETPGREGQPHSKTQKYLAVLEKGSGQRISIMPYKIKDTPAYGIDKSNLREADPSRPIPAQVNGLSTHAKKDDDGNLLYKPEVRTRNTYNFEKDSMEHGPQNVLYPVNEANSWPRGGSTSAATLGAHEMVHAATEDTLPTSIESKLRLKEPKGDWTNSLEGKDITEFENPAALAHGESGLRDSHNGGSIPFLTTHITSTEPIHQHVRSYLDTYERMLREQTEEVDKSSGDQQTQAIAERTAMVSEIRADLYKQR